MNEGVLTLLDVLRIQGFVFASNRLKDIAGGSWLVRQATDDQELDRLATSNGGRLVFAAGGNALLVFPEERNAHGFVATASRRILDEFPGLDVEVAHARFGPGGWGRAFLQAQKDLERRKLGRLGHAPLLGLAVTAECEETRLVAEAVVWETERWQRLSATTSRRRAVRSESQHQWDYLLPPGANGRAFAFPTENDSLGRDVNDTSLVGVVHVDGNGVGRSVAEWTRRLETNGTPNDKFQIAQGQLATEISCVGARAIQAVVERIVASIEPRTARGTREYVVRSRRTSREFTLRTDARSHEVYLPIRPILVAGDDITFLCDGRLALTLAKAALQVFSTTPVPSLSRPLGACAGVAIVKSHAPFAQAYKQAEELCRTGKTMLRLHGREFEDNAAIDWHVGHLATLESLAATRRREYARGGRQLHMRPYPLAAGGRSFGWLDEQVLGGASGGFLGPTWQRHRNKIKRLRELAREGPDAVASALAAWKVTADERLATLPGGLTNGFDGGSTPLIDAIELVDIHLPLD